jgi:hypothetical protein
MDCLGGENGLATCELYLGVGELNARILDPRMDRQWERFGSF